MLNRGKGIVRYLLTALIAVSIIQSGCSRTGNYAADPQNSPKTASNQSGQTELKTAENSDAAAYTAAPVYDRDFEGDNLAKGERYAEISENPFLESSRAPLSTFSIDVDTASYSNVRRFIKNGSLPPKDAVRIEEMVNYFDYDYPQPIGGAPFSVSTEVARAPWNPNHKLVQIGLQGKNTSLDNVPPANLVFLLDVSGSMNSPDKLPLLKAAFNILLDQLTAKDRVAIVVYAGASGLVLPSTSAARKFDILSVFDELKAGGSTNGGKGIQLAYKIALENFVQNGTNRVILATDGDFNVGLSSDEELVQLIERKRQSGIHLSVLGFGKGNINDSMMEKLADRGNGNYAYIDSLEEARKALGRQVAGTLYTIAKDVKIQVEFNPAKVAGYRLIGYENRLLADRDFNDDTKDAGEIGAGHTVTALYEIVPAGQRIENPGVDALRYSKFEPTGTRFQDELLTVKLRYKEPRETRSKLMTTGVLDMNRPIFSASANLKFAAAVAQFGMLLRDSAYKGDSSFESVLDLAERSRGADLQNYRGEFIELVSRSRRLKG